MTEPVSIVAYDPEWPVIFERIRCGLQSAVGEVAVAIEHVGSTAVPGLAAKPIIDIDIVVESVADVAESIRRLAAHGYLHRGDLGIAGREAFATPRDQFGHHLYLVVRGSEALRNHVEFRDYLRSHPKTAEEYGRLKTELAARFRDNREGYTDAKSEFVADVLRRAAESRANPSVVVAQ